jgi:hypothetical protein
MEQAKQTISMKKRKGKYTPSLIRVQLTLHIETKMQRLLCSLNESSTSISYRTSLLPTLVPKPDHLP